MEIDPWQPGALIVIAGIFLLAGAVKGVVGLGLPTVSLGLLTVVFGLKGAMVLMIVPSFTTNVWQGVAGGAFLRLLRRFWLLLTLTSVAIWFGAKLLHVVDTALLSALLGAVTFLYALYGLLTPNIPDVTPKERWLSPLVGVLNGAITGVTGSSVFPGVPYFQSLHMPRDEMIQAMGILFSVSALALGVAMGAEDLVPMDLGAASLAGLVPAFVGMWGGLWVRRRISQTAFRRVLFLSLLVLGAYITARALL
jgi:uncharacterized membrane protein YfcA